MTEIAQVSAVAVRREPGGGVGFGATGLDLTPAVSDVYSFTDWEKAFAAAATPSSSGKVMLHP